LSVFADSSALVKLYADEADHKPIRDLDTLVVSCLARVEVPAALWRKHRIGELAAADARLLVTAFEIDYFGADGEPPRFAAVGLPGEVLDDSARLVAVHGLRAYDAVQLSSARAVRAADPSCDTIACFDRGLRDAAAAEGFALVP
jgi:predicted nucleic acid-binding protein